jgi:hypothetical protein
LLTGDIRGCVDAWRNALDQAERDGEPALLAYNEANLSYGLAADGRDLEAEAVAARALTRARDVGCPSVTAWTTACYAHATFARDPSRALSNIREAAETDRGTGNDFFVAYGLANLLPRFYLAGMRADFLNWCQEFLGHQLRMGARGSTDMSLDLLGLVAVDLSRFDIARHIFAALPGSLPYYAGLHELRPVARARTESALDVATTAAIDIRASAMTFTEFVDFGIRAARELLEIVERDGAS